MVDRNDCTWLGLQGNDISSDHCSLSPLFFLRPHSIAGSTRVNLGGCVSVHATCLIAFSTGCWHPNWNLIQRYMKLFLTDLLSATCCTNIWVRRLCLIRFKDKIRVDDGGKDMLHLLWEVKKRRFDCFLWLMTVWVRCAKLKRALQHFPATWIVL